MPKVRKYKRKKPRKRINKSIYKSNINKQHVKVNVNAGSTPSGISYMQAPAYPNLMDINSTIKGTMQDLLKNMSDHKTEPNTVINREPLYNFENKNHNVSALSQIAENVSTLLQKAEENNPSNSFEDNFSNYDRGSAINSDDYDHEYTNLFIKPEDDKNKTESKDFDNVYNDAFKDELNLFTPEKEKHKNHL